MSDPLPKNIELKPLPFEEAIAFFKDKLPLTPDEFFALGEAARAQAFTVSRVTSMDVMVDLHGAVEKALDAGETLRDFQGRLNEIMRTRGWKGLVPWHAETVFRNNIQTAYSVGRHRQMVAQKDRFPYWQYDAVNDAHTRPTHAALDEKVWPADHPIWDTWYPPNGHRCRCSVVPVYKHVAEAEGLEIESDDPTGNPIEPKTPEGKKMPARPLMPDPGWDHNPATTSWEPDLSKYPPELRGQFNGERKER